MELELPQLLAPVLPANKQVNLTQRLTKCQADPDVVLFLATRYLHWGWGWGGALRGHRGDGMGYI